jgi:geranylgeranyl diphosphate synthase, type I
LPGDLREVVLALLATPGHVLAANGRPRWPRFVVECCLALGGPADCAAACASAAVEFVALAADLLDDVLDDDLPPHFEPGVAVNATHVLAWLGQAAALDLAEDIGTERTLLVARSLIDGMLAAHAGEHLDVALESKPIASEDLALQMTGRKSGSMVAMACRVGAALATDDAATLQLVGSFGYRAGTVAQILNDMAGVDAVPDGRGSDLRRRKKTLPVAFLLRCAEEERMHDVLDLYARPEPPSPEEEQRLAVLIHDLGALHFAWTVADAWRHEALATLASLEATTRVDAARFRRLIPSVRARGYGQLK